MAYPTAAICRTRSTRSSRTSTRRRWRSTTTSTTRRTSTNLNAALEGTEWMDRPIEAVLTNLEILPEDKQAAVRNNGGGHANHTLFWEIMGPDGGGEPRGELGRRRSTTTFGRFDDFKEQVIDAGVKRFGSGWSWLVCDGTGLAVVLDAEPGLAR